MEVLEELKEKLIQVMNMDESERARLLNPTKDIVRDNKGMSALQKLKEKKKIQEQQASQANIDLNIQSSAGGFSDVINASSPVYGMTSPGSATGGGGTGNHQPRLRDHQGFEGSTLLVSGSRPNFTSTRSQMPVISYSGDPETRKR